MYVYVKRDVCVRRGMDECVVGEKGCMCVEVDVKGRVCVCV